LRGLDLDGECGEAGGAVLGGSCEGANVCSRANCTDRFCPGILLGCVVERKCNGGQGHFAQFHGRYAWCGLQQRDEAAMLEESEAGRRQ
jgi:hypothetical protein